MFGENDCKRFIRKTKTGKEYFEFDTLYELGNLLNESVLKTPVYMSAAAKRAKIHGASQLIFFDDSVSGTKTFEEATKLLKYGWDYGTEKINARLKQLHSNSKRLKSEYSVVGSQVCVARFLEGKPTNMIKNTMTEKSVKVVNIYKAAGYNYHDTSDFIIEQSAKALQIVELLEAKGYRTNLYVIKANYAVRKVKIGRKSHKFLEKSNVFFIKVKVKSSSERLNVKKVAFCLANPAFQRRIIYRVMELCPWLQFDWSTYGIPVDNYTRFEMNEAYKEFLTESNKVFIPVEINDVNEFVNNLTLI